MTKKTKKKRLDCGGATLAGYCVSGLSITLMKNDLITDIVRYELQGLDLELWAREVEVKKDKNINESVLQLI